MTDDNKAYRKKWEAKLDEWKAEIDKLEARWRQSKADAEIDSQKRIDGFRRKESEFRSRLAELKQASGDAAQELQAGMKRAWEDVKTSFERATAQLR